MRTGSDTAEEDRNSAGDVEEMVSNVPPSVAHPESTTVDKSPAMDKQRARAQAAEREASSADASSEIKVNTLDELQMDTTMVQAVQSAWAAFCGGSGSREAAGNAIYQALYDGAPSLQSLFTTPRAVQAMRFINGLQDLVVKMSKPKELKVAIETLGFGHLNLEVTIPRVVVFRDAIVDLLEVELGPRFSPTAKDGWKALLNYIGGAIIFVKAHTSDRVKILVDSWKLVNNQEKDKFVREAEEEEDRGGVLTDDAEMTSEDKEEAAKAAAQTKGNGMMSQGVPTTYNDMFKVNAQVMGLTRGQWMDEVLDCFDAIVTNAAQSDRLKQECDVLVLRISNTREDNVNLPEYKSCMLASLRSLLPKDWSTAHEVAWSWLWDNVERLLKKVLGQPVVWEEALTRLFDSIDENQGYEMRREIYNRFFAAAPTGQDYFKQSDTRLHFIATKVLDFTRELFHEPVRMVDDISALGLRHVGYAIPTELFGPFVTACIEVMGTLSTDQVALESFRWSLALISAMLVRTITEGSTIVMKAINCNSSKMVRKAISCAPRGERATWFLKIQVGTQSISPLEWAIDSGNLDCAHAIFEDLLAIRADRKQYYFGVDELFERHPDIIRRLCVDAPTLLPTVLDGLIWRSRVTKEGKRRVNYYIKHLVITEDGTVSPTIRWMVQAGDQRIVSHPTIVLVSDTMWSKLVRAEFTFKKIWFLVSLFVFMLAEAILPKSNGFDSTIGQSVILFLRAYLYVFTLGRLVITHTRGSFMSYRAGKVTWLGRLPIPRYWKDGYSAGTLILAVLFIGLLATEPMLRCVGDEEWPTMHCPAGDDVKYINSVFAMTTMVVHWGLLVDFAVYSTGLSAFVLVCSQVLSELGRILVALVFLLLTFASAVSILDHDYVEMNDIPRAVVAFFAITVMLYEDDYRTILHQPALLAAVFLFVTASAVLLLNLLITQLSCSYVKIYADSVGYARLKRAAVIAQVTELCAPAKWGGFVASLNFDLPIEFNEGDEGLSGGVQVMEPASLHRVTSDRILRFGGSCSADMQWPESTVAQEDEEDNFERLERVLNTALKRLTKAATKKGKGRGGRPVPGGGGRKGLDEPSHLESEGSCDDVDEDDPRVVWELGDGTYMGDPEDRDRNMVMSGGGSGGGGNPASGINIQQLEELSLSDDMIAGAQGAWKAFLTAAPSKDAAGEAIYTAFFEGAPSLQPLFTTPRAVQAMRLLSSLNNFVNHLDKPSQLKLAVESLGFGHLNWDITVPRVVIFRDALMDLLEVELGEKFSSDAREGWRSLLNYIGGALVYVKSNYSERLQILSESWASVTDANKDTFGVVEEESAQEQTAEEKDNRKKKQQPADGVEERAEKAQPTMGSLAQTIPTTFKEMFSFNAAIMGMGNIGWMSEVLECFDALVTNVSNSSRLQQECDLLVLKIAKVEDASKISLGEYKSCMLAALRQLLPKEWSTSHEVAWSWLWENVERMLKSNLGSPPVWTEALARLYSTLNEDMMYEMRATIYSRFFAVAPAGQDYFKQSDSRLHFIASQVFKFALEVYREPTRMADEISALGLRHVGYAIPTELFGPFVTACIEVVDTITKDSQSVEAFRWSLALISKLLVRTIQEGSTIVMKAINTNSTKQLRRAVSCAPRGQRAQWMLLVQVGTQSISPLEWSIESGSLDSAQAIIQDLLTIRADREKYYYGVDELWDRHPDIMQRICKDAPILLQHLLEGLVWRSRNTKNDLRRVNYYIKYLIQNKDGTPSNALECLVEHKDPKIMSHPVIVMCSDTIWTGLARRQFVNSQIWFILSLIVFLMSQAILPKLDLDEAKHVRILILVGRLSKYFFTTGRLFITQLKNSISQYRAGDTITWYGVKLPEWFSNFNQLSCFILMLLGLMMLSHEPMLWCVGDANFPTVDCPSGNQVAWRYSVFTFIAMAIHWAMFTNFAVFNTQLSAFVIVISQVMREMGRFLVALMFLLFTFGSAIAVLEHDYVDMQTIFQTIVALFAITVRLYEHDYRNMSPDPALLCVVFVFVTATVILLLNLLVAQLNTTYEYVNKDSVGFARLKRAAVIVDTLETTTEVKWKRFVKSLKFDQPLEFNEGDIGLSGGLQELEPAGLHPVTVDSIFRFGGSCSEDAPWPEEQLANATQDDEDRFDSLEKYIHKTVAVAAKHLGSSSGNSGREGSSGGPVLGRQSYVDRGQLSGGHSQDSFHDMSADEDVSGFEEDYE